jgi:hypothetical protein
MIFRRNLAVSLVIASSLMAGSDVLADSFDINLRNNSAQIQYKSSIGREALGKSEFHMGALYANSKNLMGDFGILVKDEVGGAGSGINAGIGIKGLFAKTDGTKESALALGGQLRYTLPSDPRFGIVGQLYFSPSIVTFGDADHYSEETVQLEYAVIPQASAYVGYRKLELGFNSHSNVILDDGVFVGVRLSF